MSGVVFILCAITSLASAALLARAAWRPGGRLMLWSALAFVGMALNNVLLYVDKEVTGPDVDLSLYPNIAALASIAVLVYALVWEATEGNAVDDFNDFLKGAIAMGHAVASLFFLRFYWRTRDRLFVMFSLAFFLLGAIRLCMVIFNDPKIEDPTEQHYLYWIRFVAYLLILVAIIDKNVPRQRASLAKSGDSD